VRGEGQRGGGTDRDRRGGEGGEGEGGEGMAQMDRESIRDKSP